MTTEGPTYFAGVLIDRANRIPTTKNRFDCFFFQLPGGDGLRLRDGRVLGLTSEVPVVVFHFCRELEMRNCNETFVVLHQLGPSSDTRLDHLVSVIEPGDLKSENLQILSMLMGILIT